MACRPTRFPTTREPARNASTIWSTGAARNMPASARARMAASISMASRHAIATEKRPEAWLMRVEANGHGVVTDDLLNSEERADEFLLMGLRLAEGIDPKRYAALPAARSIRAGSRVLREEGAIVVDADGRLRVTQAGFPVLDAVVADLAATVVTRAYARVFTRQNSSAMPRTGVRRRRERAPASPRGRARWCRRRGTGTGRRCRQSRTGWSALRRKTLRALRSRQRRDQRHRVIGQRRGAHRIGAIFGAVAAGESCGSPTDPARHRARPASAGSRTRADCPTARCRAAGCFANSAPAAVKRIGHRHHRIAVVGDEQRVGRAQRLRHGPRRAWRDRRRISRTRRCARPCGRPPA